MPEGGFAEATLHPVELLIEVLLVLGLKEKSDFLWEGLVCILLLLLKLLPNLIFDSISCLFKTGFLLDSWPAPALLILVDTVQKIDQCHS